MTRAVTKHIQVHNFLFTRNTVHLFCMRTKETLFHANALDGWCVKIIRNQNALFLYSLYFIQYQNCDSITNSIEILNMSEQ